MVYFKQNTFNNFVHTILYTIFRPRGGGIGGQCVLLDNAVPIKGALKTQVLENASTEKASTKQRISQGWKTHIRKMQVQCKPSVR